MSEQVSQKIKKQLYDKLYREKNHEKRLENAKNYYRENKDERKEWRLKNKDKINKRMQKYYKKPEVKQRIKQYMQTEEFKRRAKQKQKLLKLEVLSFYSKGIIKCECCNEKEINFMTIDHIGGTNQKKQLGHMKMGGKTFYKWLKHNNFPDGFRVLCMNCNWGSRFFGKCPHEEVNKFE